MWFAHFAVHWLAGPGTVVPVIGRAWRDVRAVGGEASPFPAMEVAMSAPLYEPELWILALGVIASIALAWRLAAAAAPTRALALRLFVPWASLAAALHLAGVWILVQPMAMRGMVM